MRFFILATLAIALFPSFVQSAPLFSPLSYPASACYAPPISTTVAITDAARQITFSSIVLNYSGGNTFNYTPGQTIRIKFHWALAQNGDYCPGCIFQEYWGINGISSNCLGSWGGYATGTNGDVNTTFTAPTTPGIYYITQNLGLNFGCDSTAPKCSSSAAFATIVVGTPQDNTTVNANGSQSISSVNASFSANASGVFCPAYASTTYQWYRNDATIAGATLASYNTSREGNYTVNWAACTGENLTSANFTVLLIPNMTFITPANRSYNTSTIVLNVSNQTSGLDTMRLYNTSANNTYTAPVTVNLAEGTYNASAWANDSVGGGNATTVFFTVDLTQPQLSMSLPSNGSNYSSNTGLSINFTASDALSGLNGTACRLDINGTIVQPGNCNNYTMTNYAEGNYTVTVTSYDNAGNSRSNSTNFWVDYLAPTISQLSPVTEYNTTETDITFGYTAQDTTAGTMNCTIYLDGAAQTQQSRANNTQGTLTLELLRGEHTWNVACSDGVGNTTTTATYPLHLLSNAFTSPKNPTATPSASSGTQATAQPTVRTTASPTPMRPAFASPSLQPNEIQLKAKAAIQEATLTIQTSKSKGKDIEAAEKLLTRAQAALEAGNYAQAEELAQQAVILLGQHSAGADAAAQTATVRPIPANVTADGSLLWLLLVILLAGIAYWAATRNKPKGI